MAVGHRKHGQPDRAPLYAVMGCALSTCHSHPESEGSTCWVSCRPIFPVLPNTSTAFSRCSFESGATIPVLSVLALLSRAAFSPKYTAAARDATPMTPASVSSDVDTVLSTAPSYIFLTFPHFITRSGLKHSGRAHGVATHVAETGAGVPHLRLRTALPGAAAAEYCCR